jgi:IS5 family transposase
MLILDYPKWSQFSIQDYFFVQNLITMTAELTKISEILEDERFEAPIIERFKTRRGRPSVPVRVFIRLMVLKFYTGHSYEVLVEIVAKTPMYKIFCRIPLDHDVPSATALMKIVKRYGENVIEEINNELVGKLKEKGVVKGRKMRVDTTVMEANIAHPTDASLLFEGVRKLEKAMTRNRKACGKKVRQTSKKTKTMKIQLLSICKVAKRRTEEGLKEVRRITAQMAQIAKTVKEKAEKQLTKLRSETPKEQAQLNDMLNTVNLLNRVIAQTESITATGTYPKDRIISFEDPDARPIVKGKLGKKTEFGYKVQIEESENGIVTGYKVYKGNPSDKELLEDAVVRHKKVLGKAPKEVSADRGYYKGTADADLKALGVQNVCIPKIGRKSKEREAFENTTTFKRLKSWRAGSEARISCLKRSFGMDRTQMREHSGAGIWTGYGVFSHNLRQAARFAG